MTVFRIFINLGMKLVGGEYDQGAIDRELAFIDGFYGEHVSSSRHPHAYVSTTLFPRHDSNVLLPATLPKHDCTRTSHARSPSSL